MLKLALNGIKTKAALICYVVKCNKSFVAPQPVVTVAGIRKHGWCWIFFTVMAVCCN